MKRKSCHFGDFMCKLNALTIAFETVIGAGDVAQGECLPPMYKVLASIPSTAKQEYWHYTILMNGVWKYYNESPTAQLICANKNVKKKES